VLAAVEQKLAVLNDVRESIEITQTGEYVNFLRIFFPAFMHVLRSLPMSTTDDNNHKTRNTLLEILNRYSSYHMLLLTITNDCSCHTPLLHPYFEEALRSPPGSGDATSTIAIFPMPSHFSKVQELQH